MEGRDPRGMLYYGVMIDIERGDGTEGEDGWDGMDDAMGRWETATRTVRR